MPAPSPSIDPTEPTIRNLLLLVTAAARAQPDETAAEYAARFAAATAAWAAFSPRDHEERWIAAQIVGTRQAAFDTLIRATETDSNVEATRLHAGHAGLIRTMTNLMALLEKLRQRPAEALAAAPDVAFAPIPPLRRRQKDEKPVTRTGGAKTKPEPPAKTPREMTDEELATALAKVKREFLVALTDATDPRHREAVAYLPELIPGVTVPAHFLDERPPDAA
jgi:hypothetical protein